MPSGRVTTVAHATVTRLYIQARAFGSRDNAERLKARLAAAGALFIVPAERDGKRLYRVRSGPYDDLEAANAALARLSGLGNNDAAIVVDRVEFTGWLESPMRRFRCAAVLLFASLLTAAAARARVLDTSAERGLIMESATSQVLWAKIPFIPMPARLNEQADDPGAAVPAAQGSPPQADRQVRSVRHAGGRRGWGSSSWGDQVSMHVMVVDMSFFGVVTCSSSHPICAALRSLRKAPGRAGPTITLALGIGRRRRYSSRRRDFLRPLPVVCDRLVGVMQQYPEKGLDSWGLSQENVAMCRDRVHELPAFAGCTRRR